MASFTTCSGRWHLIDQDPAPGPLPRPSLRLTGVFAAVVAIGLVIGWVVNSNDVATAEVGSPAPDFTLPLIGGGTFTLSEQSGIVVINEWASWCTPCRDEIPEISAFADANPDVVVVGVAVEDTVEAATAFAGEVGATYQLAIGDATFERAYPRFGLPVTYVVDADGVVIELFNGILTEETLQELVPG